MTVATTTAMHLRANMEVRIAEYDVDDALGFVDLAQPQGGSVPCLPITGFRRFMAGWFNSVGTGGATAFHIVAATDAAGTGVLPVVSHAIGSNPNAVGDQLFLECTVEQIRETLPTATHVGVQIDMVTTTDEGVCVFIRAEPVHPRAGLTADYVV